jgi:twitching motility two-component system response regulator PilH
MKRILVIDDDRGTREVLELVFSLSGFDVETDAGDNDILSLVDASKPDIILIDYMLRGVNGGDVCRLIKQKIETPSLPVILFSACSGITDPENRYNCDAFISKPFDLSEMIEQVNSCLKEKAGHF